MSPRRGWAVRLQTSELSPPLRAEAPKELLPSTAWASPPLGGFRPTFRWAHLA